MTDTPFFSVVLSTYGRGQHIAPTIQSVLQQSFDDFELIVVGDGCADDTESVVRAFSSPRISWRNLPQNTGSQSFPNNEGIRAARGEWIVYIGHDDIWTRDHLTAFHKIITANSRIDFAIAGCIYHGPPGSETYIVTGLFDTPDAAREHFFPPSSIAHRRDVTSRIGEWHDPRKIKLPVDAEFMQRAARAKMAFVSTGNVSVHKFAAGHRYLSYLRVESNEQQDMLDRLNGLGVDANALVEISRRNGQYMVMGHPRVRFFHRTGAFYEKNRQNKGLSRPALQPLSGRVVMVAANDGRALDWHALEGGKRWSGPNPRPKILIPYTGGRARVLIETGTADLDAVSLLVETEKIAFRIEQDIGGGSSMAAEIELKPDDYTVLTLETPMFCPHEQGISQDKRRLGIAVGDIVVEPV